jgi:DNA-binding IclR family transcriptional regulator
MNQTATRTRNRASPRPPEADSPRSGDAAEPRIGSANSTADRAIDILLIFSEDKPLWSTAEIAEHFGMPRSTTYRYLTSLRSYALIVEDGSGSYRLGPRIFPLARVAKAGTSILRTAQPHLAELNLKLSEAVTLYERVGHQSIPLDRLESRHSVKMIYSRGQILPWPGAASSKVLLAHAPPDEQDAIFRLLVPVRYTAKTIKTPKLLRAALKKILADGYTYSDQEREEGVRAIAAPIFSRGDGRYCVTMSGPMFRFTDEKLPAMTAAVRATARRITDELRATDY